MGNTKKTTATNKTAKKALSFKDQVLGRLNKSEKQLQEEAVVDRIEDFTLECKAQISFIESSSIPRAEADLAKAKRELAKAKKAEKEAYFNLEDSSYESYVNSINRAKSLTEGKKSTVNCFCIELADLEAQKEAHIDILKTLSL